MSTSVDLPDLAAMEALGARIAANMRAGDVIALSGPLGAGKTTLARAILRAAGHRGGRCVTGACVCLVSTKLIPLTKHLPTHLQPSVE